MTTVTSPPPGAARKRGALAPTLIILVLLIVGFLIFSRFWTDFLWFKSVDASTVFTVQLGNIIALFAMFGGAMMLGVAINMGLALKMRPKNSRSAPSSVSVQRYRTALDQHPITFVALPALVMGIFSGLQGISILDSFIAWKNATPFGTQDAYFGLDISFFIFQLPWWQFVVSQLLTILIFSTLAGLVVHFIVGARRTGPIQVSAPTQQGQMMQVKLANPFDATSQAHLSVMMGLIALTVAAQLWLARYNFAVSDNDALFTGIGYTDFTARITATLIMAIIAVVCAVVFFANAVLRRWMLPSAAVALAVVSALVLQVAYPGIVQQFDVQPNEPDRESPYISKQIEATIDAYGLQDVEITDYQATTSVTAGQLIEDASALPGIRLMDPQVLPPTFEQLQQVRGYYSFPPVLDVDRYTIDEQETDAIVAVREINVDGLPPNDRTWANMHTVYTHGYAMVGAYGNRRQASGEPEWIVHDIPPVGAIDQTEPRVYFGEGTKHYSVVGALEGGNPVELDTPGGNQESGRETYTTYTGKGGVEIGNWAVRAMFAARYSEINLLLSSRVNNESKILFDRTPAERVAKVAPWLNIDQDPFPAIVDGRVVWIVDGYTTSNSYPNSQRVDLAQVTSDSNSSWTPMGTDRVKVNYMRNSVKAVVDAYDGTVTLYAWDPTDPLLQTFSKAYPGILHDKSEVSDELMNHLRYPLDLFKVQRHILSRYHMTDPMAWYQQSDLWRIPADPRFENSKEPPYYLSIKWPGDERPIFSETAVFTPNNRENLGAYMAVVADAAHDDYGKIRVLKLSDTHQVPGPNQTFNAIQTDERVQQALLPFTSQGAAEPVYGNLLTLPIGGGLIYVEPIYTRGKTDASYPVLRFIVVRFGGHIGIGQTLQSALDMVFEGDAGVDTGEEGTPTDPTPDGSTPSVTAEQALVAADQAFTAADAALKNGDLAEYQRQIEIARRELDTARKILEGR